jgi:predicted small lipoprotein YifL
VRRDVMFRPALLALLLAACGIKGPPRPPLEDTRPSSPVVTAPDAGCCQEAK